MRSLSEALEIAVMRTLEREKRLRSVKGTPPIVVQHIVHLAIAEACDLIEGQIERREPESILLKDWAVTECDEFLPADECVCDEEGVVLSREYAEELAQEDEWLTEESDDG